MDNLTMLLSNFMELTFKGWKFFAILVSQYRLIEIKESNDDWQLVSTKIANILEDLFSRLKQPVIKTWPFSREICTSEYESELNYLLISLLCDSPIRVDKYCEYHGFNGFLYL